MVEVLKTTESTKRARKLSPEELQSRRDCLLNYGFSSEWVKEVEKIRPRLYPEERIKAKIIGMGERGFSNPIKMITTMPTILGLSFDNIDGKIAGLTERGFGNSVKMITTQPAILGLAFDNIDRKIAGLTERGFGNPVKMITSMPSILGYSFDNIDRRLRLFRRLINLYNLELSLISIMEGNFWLFSTKIDKLIVLVRILRDYKVTENIESVVKNIVRINLENVLIALSEAGEGEDIKALMSRARRVKKRGLTKGEKREIIKEELLTIEGEKSKIGRRYFRGYPERKVA